MDPVQKLTTNQLKENCFTNRVTVEQSCWFFVCLLSLFERAPVTSWVWGPDLASVTVFMLCHFVLLVQW